MIALVILPLPPGHVDRLHLLHHRVHGVQQLPAGALLRAVPPDPARRQARREARCPLPGRVAMGHGAGDGNDDDDNET